MPLMRTRVNCGPEAAHGDLAAFAGVARDRYAGNALNRFGEVQIGELGDVFGDDRVDRAELVRFSSTALTRLGGSR